VIEQADGDPEPGVDFGPYMLRDAATGHDIWIGALPIEGIVDALKCLAREQQLPPDRADEVWASFGKSWR